MTVDWDYFRNRKAANPRWQNVLQMFHFIYVNARNGLIFSTHLKFQVWCMNFFVYSCHVYLMVTLSFNRRIYISSDTWKRFIKRQEKNICYKERIRKSSVLLFYFFYHHLISKSDFIYSTFISDCYCNRNWTK